MSNATLNVQLLAQSEISEWMYRHINEQKDPTEDRCRERVSLLAKALLAGIAIGGNLVFIPLSPTVIPYAQGAFAAGNVSAMSALDYWAGSRFIDDTLPRRSGLEKTFPKEESSMLYNAATTLNVAISVLSQLPAIYPGMDYNKGSLSIPIGILVLLKGVFIPLRSTQLSIKKFFDLTAARKLGINPEKQMKFITLIQANRQSFINMDPAKQTTFIEQLNNIRIEIDSLEKIKSFWRHLINPTTFPTPAHLSGLAYGSTEVAKMTGLIFTLIYQYVIGAYTFAKTKENILDNNVFAGLTAGLVVASEVYLMKTAIINSSVSLFHSITGINKSFYGSQQSLAEKFRNKTMIGLQTLGIGLDLLALGVIYTIWHDFFKEEPERAIFETSMCCAVFLLLHGAVAEIINDCMEETLISFTGTAQERETIKLSREYLSLQDSISKISPKYFEEFLEFLPNHITDSLSS